MYTELTKQAEEVLKTARTLARKMGNRYVGTEHLLVALRKVYRGVAGQVLAQNGLKEEDLLKVVNELISPIGEKSEVAKPEESPRLSYILENSKAQAIRLRAREIGTEHMLLAIVEDTECVGARILATLNIQPQRITQDILQAIGAEPEEYKMFQGGEKGKTAVLEQYSTDLTRQAMDGKLDAVIGRDEEIARIMQILSRRTKNNPCLIGEPGVGKTAIVEGLALRIANGIVPNAMKNKKIVTLDLAGMVAGSKYRGEFEERMKKLIQEVKSVGNVILFLDEVHTIIGAGGAEGAIDASNMLKPSLARGEIQLIGATTITEYRKHIEKDAALERRFQPIMVEEPTKEQCMAILEGVKSKYEIHHDVSIEKEALAAAVELSKRYVTDRNLPDKAIDILDEACSKVSLDGFKVPEHIRELEETVDRLAKEKEDAVKNGQMQEASLLNQEQETVREKLESARKRFQRGNRKKQICVTESAVAEVVSAWTKIPVQKLAESETARLQKLDKILHKRVIGQEEAVVAVTKAVKRGRVGLKDPNRPIGSFLFLGPTGVGKTELSKTLAEALFGNEEALIRVDMSEYMEKHSVSKMIGSPPGYVGHDDGGQLSEKVRRNPYSVILFDEIEKAHPDVFNILLQVLDDGHITDSQGRKVDFKNTVIIMTSNAGAKAIVEPKKLGFVANEDPDSDYKKMKSNVMGEVKQLFKPEFLNRIDEIIVFHALNREQMKKIVNLMCKELSDRVQKQLNIKLVIRDSVKKEIVEKGTDLKYGARPLRRAMQNILEDKMADAILEGEIQAGTQVEVGMSKKGIKFNVKADKELAKE